MSPNKDEMLHNMASKLRDIDSKLSGVQTVSNTEPAKDWVLRLALASVAILLTVCGFFLANLVSKFEALSEEVERNRTEVANIVVQAIERSNAQVFRVLNPQLESFEKEIFRLRDGNNNIYEKFFDFDYNGAFELEGRLTSLNDKVMSEIELLNLEVESATSILKAKADRLDGLSELLGVSDGSEPSDFESSVCNTAAQLTSMSIQEVSFGDFPKIENLLALLDQTGHSSKVSVSFVCGREYILLNNPGLLNNQVKQYVDSLAALMDAEVVFSEESLFWEAH